MPRGILRKVAAVTLLAAMAASFGGCTVLLLSSLFKARQTQHQQQTPAQHPIENSSNQGASN